MTRNAATHAVIITSISHNPARFQDEYHPKPERSGFILTEGLPIQTEKSYPVAISQSPAF